MTIVGRHRREHALRRSARLPHLGLGALDETEAVGGTRTAAKPSISLLRDEAGLLTVTPDATHQLIAVCQRHRVTGTIDHGEAGRGGPLALADALGDVDDGVAWIGPEGGALPSSPTLPSSSSSGIFTKSGSPSFALRAA